MARSTSTASEAQAEAPAKTVRYTGGADVRRISVADFRKAGVTDEGIKAAVWDAANGKSLPASDFTESQLEVIQRNPGFTIVEG